MTSVLLGRNSRPQQLHNGKTWPGLDEFDHAEDHSVAIAVNHGWRAQEQQWIASRISPLMSDANDLVRHRRSDGKTASIQRSTCSGAHTTRGHGNAANKFGAGSGSVLLTQPQIRHTRLLGSALSPGYVHSPARSVKQDVDKALFNDLDLECEWDSGSADWRFHREMNDVKSHVERALHLHDGMFSLACVLFCSRSCCEAAACTYRHKVGSTSLLLPLARLTRFVSPGAARGGMSPVFTGKL
eukprot:4884836-Pleurochrysis_carterae.AAC.2